MGRCAEGVLRMCHHVLRPGSIRVTRHALGRFQNQARPQAEARRDGQLPVEVPCGDVAGTDRRPDPRRPHPLRNTLPALGHRSTAASSAARGARSAARASCAATSARTRAAAARPAAASCRSINDVPDTPARRRAARSPADRGATPWRPPVRGGGLALPGHFDVRGQLEAPSAVWVWIRGEAPPLSKLRQRIAVTGEIEEGAGSRSA